MTPVSPAGNLVFPDLPTCDSATPSACYTSIDNLGPLTANELTIGGGKLYQIYPTSFDNPADTITLNGNGGSPNIGLTAAPTTANLQLADFGIPITLGNDQQWNVSNYGILYVNSIGGGHALTLNLNNGYVQANDIETSSVTVSGPGDLQLDQFAPSPERLPNVTVTGAQSALTVATANATTGAITVNGANNNFIVLTDKAPGETYMQAGGDINLDATTNVEFDIDGNNTALGTDSSRLTTTHAVNFNGAGISLWQARDAGNCDTLATGNTYTLVQGGALSGQISIGGKLISPGQTATETLQSNAGDCPTSAAKTTAIVNYTANSITATIAGPPVVTSAPTISGTTTVGDKLTVTNNGNWTAAPAPTYTYQWESCSGSTCSPINGATASSYTLTSANVGKTIEAAVTATNDYGKASATSNALGPVKAAPSSGGGGGSTVTSAQIRAALAHLAYPRGHRAVRRLIRTGVFRTQFRAPAAGTLTVVWKTTIRTGHGHHAKRHTYVIARGVVHARSAGRVTLTMHLTAMGRMLLRRHPFSLRVTAVERFVLSGGRATTLVRRFTL